jgi:type III restriction enzyme
MACRWLQRQNDLGGSMPKKLSFKFDPNQAYQLAAIKSVVQLFEGLPKYDRADFTLNDEIVPNLPPDESIYEDFLLDNLKFIQNQNKLPESINLEVNEGVDDGMVLEGAGYESWRSPRFTIEMETGTGKTYVYLRTIYELRKHYGFSKFIIVVPSVAIFEGVRKAFQITYSHFSSLYGNEVVNLVPYDGAQLNRVKNFATSSFTEIMVMTDDSFNKITNNLYKPSEKLPGDRLPYQFIQETRPILILDEPQSIDNTEKAKEAIRTLHPLFSLRYSATHRIKPNLVYRLTPIDAYQQNLVKKIQVIGITEEENFNRPTLTLESVTRDPITAKVKTLVQEKGATKEATVTLKQGDNLYEKTHRTEHQDGYRIIEISVAKGNEFVQFENNFTIRLNENLAPSRPEVFRFQIRETIKQHMTMQEKLLNKGIKVLSLFFIDRVANYTTETGIIRTIFNTEFERIKAQYPHFQKYTADQVQEGYFAKKKQKSGEEVAIDTEGRTAEQREAERQAFDLIMRKKEQLLSFDEPVSFIFAHSALKEGWDNPNVFQICTLNQTVSDIKKRQEIGRGLRLCVNQTGERILDDDINILTVIANESYEKYAENLQREYLEAGEEAPPTPKRPQQSIAIRRDELFYSENFQEFWTRLCQKTSYTIHIDTNKLITECISKLNVTEFLEARVVLSKGKFVITEYTLSLQSVSADKAKIRVDVRCTDNTTENNIFGESEYSIFEVRKNSNDIPKKYPLLRGLKVLEIVDRDDESIVKFSDKAESEITYYKPLVFTSEKGQVYSNSTIQTIQDTYPVFNLVDRVAKDTNLTRATINSIFQGMDLGKKEILLRNPEGFANTFTSTIKGVITQHIADNIEFTVKTGSLSYNADDLFPPTYSLPQKELIDAGQRGLYDKVQRDSDVEERFVNYSLRHDEDNVILYFKFPPKFKINFPKIIGNYNPDWGIVRRDRNGNHTLQLVRETKGTTNIDKLRFAQEPLKIKCAQKHFSAIGVDYRVIDDTTSNWWVSESENIQADLFE